MNPGVLFANFDRLSDVPSAIPQLRRFVFSLAARGKLVEWNPAEEPASEFVSHIRGERTRLEKAGEIRKQQFLPDLDTNTIPFSIPKHWKWLQLREIGALTGGMTPSMNRPDFWNGEIDWFSPKDFREHTLSESELKITSLAVSETRLEVYKPGSLFMVARSGILKRTFPVAINTVRATANQDLKVLTPFVKDVERYLQIVFWGLTEYILSHLVKTGTTVQSLKYEEFELLPLPLAPTAEQQRIVAKVDELMALCDKLEQKHAERDRVREGLTAASIHNLNNVVSAESFRQSARFYLAHLPQLTVIPKQILGLRQSILNLAVRGKLLNQDPADEPASELLRQIRETKECVAKGGKGRKEQALPPINSDQVLFPLPTGWAWARFPELGTFGRGKSKHRPRNDTSLFDGGTHLVVQTGDVARSGGLIRTHTSMYNEIGLAQSLKWPKGTLCITIAANIADSGILSFDACFPDSVVGFVPTAPIPTARYFEYFVRTAKANLLEFAPATAQKNINLEILNAVLIPVPPLAEQLRIVARVDELMAVCDRLEAQLNTTQVQRLRLLESVLYHALNDREQTVVTAPALDTTRTSIANV